MENEEKKRVTVEIYGELYTIVGTESEDHVRQVANMVNDQMKEIKEKMPKLDTKRLAVLTAVNAVNDYLAVQDRSQDKSE